MAYCQPADVQQVLNPLGGQPSPASPANLPTTIVQANCARAEDFVNGWLAGRYDVPFDAEGGDQVPDLVARVTIDVAAFYCVLQAAGGLAVPPTHPQVIAYQNALSTLRALSSGAMSLALPATDGPDTGTQENVPAGVDVANPNLRMFTPADAGLRPGWPGRRRNPLYSPSESDFY